MLKDGRRHISCILSSVEPFPPLLGGRTPRVKVKFRGGEGEWEKGNLHLNLIGLWLKAFKDKRITSDNVWNSDLYSAVEAETSMDTSTHDGPPQPVTVSGVT